MTTSTDGELPGQTTSFWRDTSTTPTRATLGDISEAEVCVVGAGIAGLTAAYLLAREGRRVVVLDDGPVGGGETGQTTAHLSPILRERYKDLESMHGKDGARAIADAHRAAIDTIEEIAQREGIGCEFERVDGHLVLGRDDKPDLLQRELEALGRAGIEAELVENYHAGGFNFGPALRFPRQGRFHPLKYLDGLAEALARLGVTIAADAHVTKVQADKAKKTVTVTLQSGHELRAGDVVVATNSPIHTRVTYHTKIAPYRTYVVALRVPRGTLTSLVWDTEDPYHYVRTTPGERDTDILIVGGEDHKTAQEADFDARYGNLVTWARERFAQAAEVAWRWSGQVMESVDAIGYNGRDAGDEHVWVITGDSGNGLTNGTLGARIVADGILGRANAWAKTFDPARSALDNPVEWIKENANVAAQFADWLKGGDVKGVDEIARGAGAIVTHGLANLAVYRDEQGELSACSAVCPHAGCLVAWNNDAKSWDCPCHGSRFAPHGDVINGPAVTPLARIEKPAQTKT